MDVDSRGLEKLGKAKGGERYKKKPTGTKVGPVAPTNKELGLGKKRATVSRIRQDQMPPKPKPFSHHN